MKKIHWVLIITILVFVGGVFYWFESGLNRIQDSDQSNTTKKLDSLKKEIQELKNNNIQVTEDPTNIQTQDNLTSIIKEWRKNTAYIICDYKTTSGKVYLQQTGSGYISPGPRGEVWILTNAHVLKSPDGWAPALCSISWPDYSGKIEITSEDMMEDPNYDVAFLFVKNPSLELSKIASAAGGNCKEEAVTGDQVIIIGYPSIGSQDDITVTDGIISGYDNGYYITSAKIDQGNSGGLAISIKNNCYLGIPSFAILGEIESLGRILNINALLKGYGVN